MSVLKIGLLPGWQVWDNFVNLELVMSEFYSLFFIYFLSCVLLV